MQEEHKHHPLGFIPFGHGKRICLGRNVAYEEIHIVLTHVIRNFKIRFKQAPKYSYDVFIAQVTNPEECFVDIFPILETPP